MDSTVTAIEFEAMTFVRHLTLTTGRRTARNLDRSAYTVLCCLEHGGAMSIGELSDAIGLDPSTLNRQTSAMLQAGLVERIPDPDGGVARKFRATTEGQSRLHEACETNMRTLREVTDGWSPTDLAAFAGHLERFNRRLEELDRRPWPRSEQRLAPSSHH